MLDVKHSLHNALAQLDAEKEKIERHITAVRRALAAVEGGETQPTTPPVSGRDQGRDSVRF